MKQMIKRAIPAPWLRGYHRLLRAIEGKRNSRRSAREVFSDIYQRGKWGHARLFNSGTGSADETIVSPYIAAVEPLIRGAHVLDLGCGDFAVGARLLDSCASYIGVDVVPELVEHLRATVHSAKASFQCLDIVTEGLPEADICLVRQVFQHLSNAEILAVLPKLRRYRMTIITEHHPVGEAIRPNIDKPHGPDIRLYRNSGVFLDQPPFSLASLHLILEVGDGGRDTLYAPGVIRTFIVS